MKKGMAINFSASILLGLFVLAIIVVLLFQYVSGSKVDLDKCKASATSWCAQCKAFDFNGGPEVPQLLKDCYNKYGTDLFSTLPTSCKSMEGDCKKYLPKIS